MKTGELANALNVTDKTIRNWIDNPLLREFFSPEARGETSLQRIITEADVLTASTIAYLKNNGTRDFEEIAQYLKTGKRESKFPQVAIEADLRNVPIQMAEQGARLMAITQERDDAIREKNELVVKLQNLEATLTAERENSGKIKESLLREIAALNLELGKALGKLEAYENRDSGKGD